MQVYLPIAEMSLNLFVLIGMGTAVGFLSGMFGVGGGFLMTPLLIFWASRRRSPWAPRRTRSWPRPCRA